MGVCRDQGWSETNQPVCVACANPIRVRGDSPEVSVLVGEVIGCQLSDWVWFAHFDCRKHEWQFATPTENWWIRKIGFDRTYVLLTSRPDWVRTWPEFTYVKR
jgi:hypothetical protein